MTTSMVTVMLRRLVVYDGIVELPLQGDRVPEEGSDMC